MQVQVLLFLRRIGEINDTLFLLRFLNTTLFCWHETGEAFLTQWCGIDNVSLHHCIGHPLSVPLQINKVDASVSYISCFTLSPCMQHISFSGLFEDFTGNTMKFTNRVLSCVLAASFPFYTPIFQKL